MLLSVCLSSVVSTGLATRSDINRRSSCDGYERRCGTVTMHQATVY